MDNFGYVYYDDYVKVLTNEETYPVTKRGHLHPPTDMWRMAANYAVNIFSIKFVFLKFRFYYDARLKLFSRTAGFLYNAVEGIRSII